MACIIFLLGDAALGTEKKGGLASEVVQILDRLSWDEIVCLLWCPGSLWDQEEASWVLCDTTLKGTWFCRWLFAFLAKRIYGWQKWFVNQSSAQMTSLPLLPSWDLVTLQNSHLFFLACCHILKEKEASWGKRRRERRVGGLLLIIIRIWEGHK